MHVIGCGATGSWLAFTLAKMGVQNIHLYDFDVIEMHNLPNQMFGLTDIGRPKAEALGDCIKAFTGITPVVHIEKVDASTQIRDGYVFILVDTMSARTEIFNALRLRFGIKGIIETRMGLDLAQLYVLGQTTLKNSLMVKRYTDTLYSDDVAETSLCGTSTTVLTTTLITSSYAVRAFISLVKGEDLPLETHIGVGERTILSI